MSALRSTLVLILLGVVFLSASQILEYAVTRVPGTPNYTFHQQLLMHHNGELAEWVRSARAAAVMEAAAAVRYLAVLPLAALLAGVLGSRLSAARRWVVAVVVIAATCIALMDFFAAFALSRVIGTLTDDGIGVGSDGFKSLCFGIVLRLVGLAIAGTAAWLGHTLGKRYSTAF